MKVGLTKLEKITKRIDESIKQNLTTLHSNRCYTRAIVEMQAESYKALEMYKEFITELESMQHPVYNWRAIVIQLEEKYYPQPGIKTIKEKLNDIINHNATVLDASDIINSLIKLRDEIED